MGKRKCPLCNEYINDIDETVDYKQGRVAHRSCFQLSLKVGRNIKQEELDEKASQKKKPKVKPKAELKDSISEEDYKEKKQYYDYLKTLMNMDSSDNLTAKIYALSDNYINRYGFNFNTMYKTLVYMSEIKGLLIKGDIVGLIPYYYSEAESYYEELKRIESSDVNVKDMYKKQTVLINPSKRKVKQLDF